MGMRRARTLLVSAELSCILVFREEADRVTDATPPEETITVAPEAAQIEQSMTLRRRVRLGVNAPDTPLGSRVWTEFDFASVQEREWFCAHANLLKQGARATAGLAARHVWTDPAPAWTQPPAAVPLRLFVTTFNVGKTPPPRDTMERWIPHPSNETRDLYVVGLQVRRRAHGDIHSRMRLYTYPNAAPPRAPQETGSTSNRDAWVLAVLEHLNSEQKRKITKRSAIVYARVERATGGG